MNLRWQEWKNFCLWSMTIFLQNDKNAVELTVMSDIVIAYEKEHFPIKKPTIAELIELSLEEKGMSQKQLAGEIGISPSRVNDFVSGRSEPTFKDSEIALPNIEHTSCCHVRLLKNSQNRKHDRGSHSTTICQFIKMSLPAHENRISSAYIWN